LRRESLLEVVHSPEDAMTRNLRRLVAALFLLALSFAGRARADGPGDAQAFLASLDARFPQAKRLRLNRVPTRDLLEQGEKLKGYYYILDVSSVTFAREAIVDKDSAAFLAMMPSGTAGVDAPAAFMMPNNNWFKDRKDISRSHFSYSCGPSSCDKATIVGEPTGEAVVLPVGAQGDMKRMPKIRIVAIADKNGVWDSEAEPSGAKKAK
jgi:hypothetical protein